jgi:hypothetical protein
MLSLGLSDLVLTNVIQHLVRCRLNIVNKSPDGFNKEGKPLSP